MFGYLGNNIMNSIFNNYNHTHNRNYSHRNKYYCIFLLIGYLLLMLPGCGQTGALYLPEENINFTENKKFNFK